MSGEEIGSPFSASRRIAPVALVDPTRFRSRAPCGTYVVEEVIASEGMKGVWL